MRVIFTGGIYSLLAFFCQTGRVALNSPKFIDLNWGHCQAIEPVDLVAPRRRLYPLLYPPTFPENYR